MEKGVCFALLVACVALVAAFIASTETRGLSETEQKFSRWIMGSSASETTASSHPDEKRATVGWTAFAVALFRASESSRVNPLFSDPIALKLFEWSNFGGGAPLSARVGFSVITTLPFVLKFSKLGDIQTLVSARTHFIDHHILKSIQRGSIGKEAQQLVIIGAGLDARAFRLAPMFETTKTSVFEVDFPGMLAEKRRMFRESGFDYKTLAHTKQVNVDLTRKDELEAELMKNGFEPSLRTVWLMEGLTAYLEESELGALLGTIRSLSPSGSRIIATWLGNDYPEKLSMHRFFSDDPSGLLTPFGFSEQVDVVSLKDHAEGLGRSGGSSGYLFSCNEKPFL